MRLSKRLLVSLDGLLIVVDLMETETIIKIIIAIIVLGILIVIIFFSPSLVQNILDFIKGFVTKSN